MRKQLVLLACLYLGVLGCSSDDDSDTGNGTPTEGTPCENGMAGNFPCNGIDLRSQIALSDFSAASANDIWGWKDPGSGKEYAIIGLDNGTAFVDISDDLNPVYLGKMPTATVNSSWRDVKVFKNHAFVVSEAAGHGLQVFDLGRLAAINNAPETLTADATFAGFGNAHNLMINEATGYAYVVGTDRQDQYKGGVHFIDVNDPKNPTAAGGYGGSAYTHDAQVVSYQGPDTDYQGKEIFIGANENRVVLVDVTDKSNPEQIASIQYDNIAYTHQGWFTEDQRYFILGDELDEVNFGLSSRTLVFDFSDLDKPVLDNTYLGKTSAIDHNGYVKGNAFYLANYTAGIRIMDISNGQLTERAHFDTYPNHDAPEFKGVWSVYPYFESGKIIVSDINSGLFVLRESN
ncbi:choice-of-anchor B family protein [Sediminicola luteus]|uniref:Regulator n=1 Tax=Sediminicola luteus TaxID=319238 RepID=A0A2A4GEG7_9FLAO|nr:choice-of-anchor B family protein [Sediminicola luteus]PCE66404.1 regulator [Sediminicola luteus]